MNILITIPGITPHGGHRVILEWANRLTNWHNVTVLSLQPGTPNWFNVSNKVKWCFDYSRVRGMDIAIITSPHSVPLIGRLKAKKTFIFCQMAEHLFRPNDRVWNAKCQVFYQSSHPMIAISKWNMELFKRKYETYYVGNGVNFDHFPIVDIQKDYTTVLVEGWESGNPSKDPDAIGHKVAERLKNEGYKILAYSAIPIKTMKHVPHEYYERPTLERMNELYNRATILIKASKYDARACAPVEAMTKRTVTARAIIQGDDDLIHGENSLRCGYDEDELYKIAKYLLTNPKETSFYADNCLKHVQKNTWDYWINHINEILTS